MSDDHSCANVVELDSVKILNCTCGDNVEYCTSGPSYCAKKNTLERVLAKYLSEQTACLLVKQPSSYFL